MSDKQSPIISTDGQITFIDEEDFEEDELNDKNKENIEVMTETRINDQHNQKNLVNILKENDELDLKDEKEHLGEILNEVDKKASEEPTKKHNIKNEVKSIKILEEKPKQEKRCVSEKVHRLSKVIEEPEESSSIEVDDIHNENIENYDAIKNEILIPKKLDNDCKVNTTIDEEEEISKTDYEKAKNNESSDEVIVKEKASSDVSIENSKNGHLMPEKTHSIHTNSLVPIIIHKNSGLDTNTTTDIPTSEIGDHFDFDGHKIKYENDSLLYLHEYLKTYIENNYEVMRAFNKKDKYLNQKIKIHNNKHNRKHLKNMLLCQCGGPCCNCKQYNVQESKIQGSIYELAPLSNKPKGKYVWFQDPETDDEEAYYVNEKSNTKGVEIPEFNQDCVACLEEKINLDLFDSKCLECIEEYKEKCIKRNHVISNGKRNRFKNVHPDRAAKNKALKIIYDNKNIPKRSSSEIICKSLKLKYERNHLIRKNIKRHGIRFDLHNQLAPISYNRIKNGSKMYDKLNKNRRYSEELLYTAYLDLELRKKFPDLSRVNNHIVNRSSSLLLSTQNPYRVSSHKKNRSRYESTKRISDKVNNSNGDSQTEEVLEAMSDETKEYESIINKHIQKLINPIDSDEDKPDKRTIDELLEEVKNKENIEELYRISRAEGNKKLSPNNKSVEPLGPKSNIASRSESHKEFVRNSKDGKSHTGLRNITNNVIGKDILQQRTNPLIELLFEKSKSNQNEDSSPSSPSRMSPDHQSPSKKNQKGKLYTVNEIQFASSEEEDCDQNNNTQKELTPRQSKVLDQLFENRRNRIEEFRIMGNNQSLDSHIDMKEGNKVNSHRSRKLFSFNFKRSPTKHFESNLERPISLQNLHDIRFAENGSQKMIEDYRRPISLQRLNETSYQNTSIFQKTPKNTGSQSILDHPNSLHKLHGTFSKTHSSLLGSDMKEIPLDVRQRSASLDQFHRREPILLTRNTSFLHSRKSLSQSLSNESGSVNDRTVKRSRSLIQRIFPLGRSKKKNRKKQEEQEKPLKEMVSA